MATIDEVVAVQDDLKKARFRVTEITSKARRLVDQIEAAKKRLIGVEQNLSSCRQALAKAHTAPVVSLYAWGVAEAVVPGDWLKAKKLVDQNGGLIVRIKGEISERTAEHAALVKELPFAEANVRAIERKAAGYGIVREFKE